jgi:hypothetical protein
VPSGPIAGSVDVLCVPRLERGMVEIEAFEGAAFGRVSVMRVICLESSGCGDSRASGSVKVSNDVNSENIRCGDFPVTFFPLSRPCQTFMPSAAAKARNC